MAGISTPALGTSTNTPSGTQDVNIIQIGGATVTLGQALMAASIPVVIASNQSPVSVDTELPAAVALADGVANPTVPGIGAFLMGWDGGDWARILSLDATADDKTPNDAGLLTNDRLYGFDGTNWDRLRGDSVNGLLVNLGANNDVTLASTTITGTVAVTQSGTWDEVGINDSGNVITVDGSGTAGTAAAGVITIQGIALMTPVQVSQATASNLNATVVGTGTFAVQADTELPAAVALGDGTANPTVPGVGAFMMGWSGGSWDRVFAYSPGDNDNNDRGILVNARNQMWDGVAWDRVVGNSTDGQLVNLGANNDVTVTGSVTANAGTNLNTSLLALESGGNLATATASLGVMDDWDNGASDGVSVSGDVAADSADAGEPVKIGGKAVDIGANGTDVSANDRVNSYFLRSGQQLVLGGHQNIVNKHFNQTDADGAQTDTALVTVSAGTAIIVTMISVTADNANTADVGVRIGFGTANTPSNDANSGVVLSHPGIAKGSGVVLGNGSGIIGMGASNEDLRITSEDATGGNLDILVSYFTIAVG